MWEDLIKGSLWWIAFQPFYYSNRLFRFRLGNKIISTNRKESKACFLRSVSFIWMKFRKSSKFWWDSLWYLPLKDILIRAELRMKLTFLMSSHYFLNGAMIVLALNKTLKRNEKKMRQLLKLIVVYVFGLFGLSQG